MRNKTLIETNLRHLNNNVLCAIAIRTDGPNPRENNLIQVCVMPINSFFEPSKNVLPFNLWMHPMRISPVVKCPKEIYMESLRSRNPNEVARLFEEWVKRLGLPYGHKICPLVYDWVTVRPFLESWLDPDVFGDFFDWRVRDLLSATLFVSDRQDSRLLDIQIPKYQKTYIFSQLNATMDHSDPGNECLALAKSYKRLQEIFVGI